MDKYPLLWTQLFFETLQGKTVVYRRHVHSAAPASTGLSVSAKCGTATVNK